MRLILSVVTACLLSAACAAAGVTPGEGAITADQRGDAVLGRVYAREVCAVCHAVEIDETISPHPDAPTFAEIANAPGMTSLALDVWLHSAHEQMPQFMLDADHVDDLAAYLHTLKQTP